MSTSDMASAPSSSKMMIISEIGAQHHAELRRLFDEPPSAETTRARDTRARRRVPRGRPASSLFSNRWRSAPESKSLKRKVKSAATATALAIYVQVESVVVEAATTLPHHQQQQAWLSPSSIDRRDDAAPSPSSSSTSNSNLSIKHNIPLQLVVVVFSVVLFAMFVGSLAWLCRRGSCGGKDRRKAKSWSPTGNRGVFATESASASDSSSILSAAEKRRSKINESKDLYSPLPKLKKDRSQRQSRTERDLAKDSDVLGGDKLAHMPELPLTFRHADQVVGAAMIERPAPTFQQAEKGARGWQLYDSPVPVLQGEGKDNQDVEAAGLPPARRPTFVQRLLQHRSGSLAEFPAGIDDVDAPATPAEMDSVNRRRGQQNSSSSGSVLLSVLSGSLHVLPTSLRNVASRSNTASRLNATKAAATRSNGNDCNSDFEGTIGGRDRDLPMAKRIGPKEPRRMLLCDATSIEETRPAPPVHLAYGPGPLATPAAAMFMGTPKTPGLAGVGSVWHRQRHEQREEPMSFQGGGVPGSEGPRAPTLAELKRQQALFEQGRALQFGGLQVEQGQGGGGIQRWVQMASTMAEPLSPPVLSRHGSIASTFLYSVANEASKEQHKVSSRKLLDGVVQQQQEEELQQRQSNVERVPSIRPHFIATTTLQSWLTQGQAVEQDDIQEEDEGGMSSILDQYLDDDQSAVKEGGKKTRTRNLWEKESLSSSSLRSRSTVRGQESSNSHPPSYRTRENDSSSFTLSSAETSAAVEASRAEVSRPERAQIDKLEGRRIKEPRRRSTNQAAAAAMPTYEEATGMVAMANAPSEKDRYEEARKQERRAARKRERAGWTKEEEEREQERRDLERRIKDKKRQEKRKRRRARRMLAEQEQQAQQEQELAASRPKKKTSIEELDNLASRNAPCLSPPESPLTSASESNARQERRICSASTAKEFLVEKKRKQVTPKDRTQQRRRQSGAV
ncbi:hypothetical protein FA10DRAFT_188734 [Acaromyces ingoldii]|uniref:Uncharacterized protein n=1 Tax=Acaromyces ingoldii TaxID=215250 RepID=A0A316YEA6_9BASI|nr:hypothetical protein FA10DRAFT_188734 [Acaromyces ingoldii]PWN87559.1 hypothetical protein FA10DRAFT_188734 [Acaromyces ingoldii]